MQRFVHLVTIAAVAVVVAAPANAAKKHHRVHVSQSARAAYASQPQIACTRVGCIPIPRHCHPEMGYTPNGTPTGFDVAVCGNYTLYGLRR